MGRTEKTLNTYLHVGDAAFVAACEFAGDSIFRNKLGCLGRVVCPFKELAYERHAHEFTVFNLAEICSAGIRVNISADFIHAGQDRKSTRLNSSH